MPQTGMAEQPNPVALAHVVEVERALSILVGEHEHAAHLRTRALLLKGLTDGRQHVHVALARNRFW
jgi:hypothetical protein